jgi:hypothetical protein
MNISMLSSVWSARCIGFRRHGTAVQIESCQPRPPHSAYHGTLRCSQIVESRIRPAECGPPTATLLLITRKRHVPMALSLFTDVSPFVFSGVYGAVRTVRVGPAGKYARSRLWQSDNARSAGQLRAPDDARNPDAAIGEGTGCSNTGAALWGTEGSNPSLSSAESSANLTFGFPRQAPTAIAGASRNKITSRIYGVGE